MKFAFGFITALAASAVQHSVAFPAASTRDISIRAPVPVKSVTCDGDTYKCTAGLVWGDGNWLAQWTTSVFHQATFARPSAQEIALMAPVPVKAMTCDGNTYVCTANLVWGDGNWVAQWTVAVFHQSLFGHASSNEMSTMAPVKVTSMTCDGDTYKCTAALDFGDGRWVAQWTTAVFHNGLVGSGFFLQ
ncbi:hypothetical protein BDZ94DRAFT_1310292 [Collybia nuda]|uniref:Ig-like domain-containing protein n=1 Tax=Collybia nuda TaxID=64659 RepID=A0A9P6CIF7_9AGAR|nr:hypothetical protein BDZ94DRAFT_1310292 [Collybia nuda]